MIYDQSQQTALTEWNLRFLGLAWMNASFSKDPSTQVGAVIVRPNKSIASFGFNGLPQGIKDTSERLERELKYKLILHAEENALEFCMDSSIEGYDVYVWPMQPCPKCTSRLVQNRVGRVISVYDDTESEEVYKRWEADFSLAREILEEAGIELLLFPKSQIEACITPPAIDSSRLK